MAIYFSKEDGAPPGTVSLSGTLRRGVYTGEVVAIQPDGKKFSNRTFLDGELISARAWSRDGSEKTPEEAKKIATNITASDLKFIKACLGVLEAASSRGHRVPPAK